jgi:hypothetical protein
MTLLVDFLTALERVRIVDGLVVADELGGQAEKFHARKWIVDDGHQTSIVVPVMDGEEEVEVVVDQDNRTFSYCSPALRGRTITRPLTDVAIFAFNVDIWLDEIAEAFGIEPSHRSRNRNLVEGHLWHVGDVRIGRTHQFAPIYVARRLELCPVDWRKALLDPIRPGQGIVLTADVEEDELPNDHQVRSLECLLVMEDAESTIDHEILQRLLRGWPSGGSADDEWFTDSTGELKLHGMAEAKIFKNKQKSVIAHFWRQRNQPSLKWSEVIAATQCGKDPGSVFGKDVWRDWLENVEFGLYRIRIRR